MMRRIVLMMAGLALAGCAATAVPCDRDGGIGGTGGCATAPADV